MAVTFTPMPAPVPQLVWNASVGLAETIVCWFGLQPYPHSGCGTGHVVVMA